MPVTPARRLWIVPDAPPDLVANCPDGYGAGTCVLAYGGTPDGNPPTAWITNLPAFLGLTQEAADTLVCRHAGAFLWSAYWDPTGQATPAEPKIQIWPPE